MHHEAGEVLQSGGILLDGGLVEEPAIFCGDLVVGNRLADNLEPIPRGLYISSQSFYINVH